MYNVPSVAGDLQKLAWQPRETPISNSGPFDMFRIRPNKSERSYRTAIIILLGLSFAALLTTIWIMVEFGREQTLIQDLVRKLPTEESQPVTQLAGELLWQFRLTSLVVLNSVVTFFALLLLWRAYRSSQDSLRDIRALAGDIISSVDQAIITTDVQGRITSINQRGIQLLSLNDEYVGRSLSELNEKLQLEGFRTKARESQGETKNSDFHVCFDGNDRTLRAQCQRLTDWQNEDIGNVLQLRDVTQRELIESRIRRMERFMGLGSLAAGLHHEIKNPLAALSLHVQLLNEHLETKESDDDTCEMVNVIKVELNRISRVLEGFRDFASLENFEFASVDVGELVRHQVVLIQPRAASSGVQIDVRVPKSLPNIHADHVRIEQVLVNLFVNALEAMPDGGTLSVLGERIRSDSVDAVRLSISDSGNGIPKDLMDDIFDPYFSTKSQGTGMGLAFCDKIIRQHHGSIDLASSQSGTVFEVTLPLFRNQEVVT